MFSTIKNLFKYHPYGKKYRILRHFGYWYCYHCNKLHSPKVEKYYHGDNDTVCGLIDKGVK